MQAAAMNGDPHTMNGHINEKGRYVVDDASPDERTYATLIHLSILAHSVFTLLAFGLTLVLWLVKKDESAYINDHGREAVNFQISLAIYSIIFGILAIVLIGIPFLMAIPIFAIICMIIAAMAANRGELYRYPMTIRFLNG